MRIHTDTLTYSSVYDAANRARVNCDTLARHGSRSREHAFEIILSGESRRHQNGGENKAATWDQWGVFLGILWRLDPNLKVPYYKDLGDFHFRTAHRFSGDGFPADYHGDHRFQFSGTLYQQECTKCSAVTRWQ